MKKLIFILVFLSFSCSKKTDTNKLGYFTGTHISIDTLVIDSNNEIIYTTKKITGSDISFERNYLFNFNAFDHTLEQINLDKLKLEKKLPFEKEGPNGTGYFVDYINITEDNYVLVKGINKTELFNLNGEKLRTIEYENYSLGWDKGGEVHIPSPLLDTYFDRLFVLINKELEKSYALGILDTESNEINSISLNSYQGFEYYTFSVTVSKATINTPQKIYLSLFDRKLMLSNQVDNGILLYDIEENRIYTKFNHSQLHNDKKEKDYQFEHESFESKDAEYSKFLQEINFLHPFWDEINQIFFRFSYEELESGNKDDDHVKIKTYLTALDKDFNLLGEMYLPELNKLPLEGTYTQFPKHFAKDGNIWIYENINDEMGFVVLTISK